jgi:hypothetical protein
MLVAADQQDDQGALGAKVSTSDHLYRGGAMVETDCLGQAAALAIISVGSARWAGT